MLAVYCVTRSLLSGCIYKRIDVMAVCVWCLLSCCGNTLQLGFDYAIEKNPKQYINTLTIETGNAIRHLDAQIQNIFRYLASRKMKQTAETNTHNTLHKRHQYNLKQI